MDTAEGFVRPPGVGGEARRGAVGGGQLARGVPRPRRLARRVGDLRGGVLPRRRTRPGQPERHLPALPHDLRERHRRSSRTAGSRRWPPASRSGRRPGPSPRPAPTSPRCGRRAERDEARGGWVLNGQKTWSSRAAYAHWGFGLFRSDPESQRHHGLTYFCFPLDAEGVTVRPIAQLDGEPGFAELFFDDVFVPDADVLGEPGAGLVGRDEHGGQRARSLAALPRPVLRHGRPAGRAVARAGRAGRAPRPRRRRVAGRRGLPALHLGHRRRGSSTAGRSATPARSTRCSGPTSTWPCTRRRSTCSGPTVRAARARGSTATCSRCPGPIYAGTNEVQRNVIAERILGLPRESRKGA